MAITGLRGTESKHRGMSLFDCIRTTTSHGFCAIERPEGSDVERLIEGANKWGKERLEQHGT